MKFYHADYEIGCGGSETPMKFNNKTFLYVWNKKKKKHEYYIFEDDVFITDIDFNNQYK